MKKVQIVVVVPGLDVLASNINSTEHVKMEVKMSLLWLLILAHLAQFLAISISGC